MFESERLSAEEIKAAQDEWRPKMTAAQAAARSRMQARVLALHQGRISPRELGRMLAK